MNLFRASVIFIFIMLTCLISHEAYAFNTYLVGEEIVGQGYNDVWKRWYKRKFSIWVGVRGNAEFIFFVGETGLGDATVMVDDYEALREKFKNAIKKAIEWSNVARKNQADTKKSLGCFAQDDRFNICEETGLAFKENQMGLSFFATNGGRQTNLIISIVDRNNQFIKTSIYVDLPEMIKLLKVVDQIEGAFQKARKTAKDQKLFK